MQRLGILGFAAAALLAACGGNVSGGGGGGGGGSEGATFTGSITGTAPTVIGAAGYAANNQSVGVSIDITISGGTASPSGSFVIILPASNTSLSTGTFTSSNVYGAEGSVSASTGTGSNAFSLEFGSGQTAQGTFTLSITNTGTQFSAGGGTEWGDVHGTLQATLPDASGGSGSVTVNATF